MLTLGDPEIIYLRGDALVPSKALRYKPDKRAGGKVEVIPPYTRRFERGLHNDLAAELDGVEQFPTREDVFVAITHGLHARKRYDECDLDNRAKTVLDAMGGVVYFDDTQVAMLWTDKELLRGSDESYFRIVVKVLTSTAKTRIRKHIGEVSGG